MTIKEELQKVKVMVNVLITRSSTLGPTNLKEIQEGQLALVRLEELIDDLDPEGVK
jgi:hypothetical protein